MNIAMFTDYFAPELSGIHDSTVALATALGSRGHEVTVYAPAYSTSDYGEVGQRCHELDLGRNVSVRRRRSLRLPSPTRQSRLAIVSPTVWIRFACNYRPNIIHIQSFLGMGLEGLLVARTLGIPVVVTNHSALKAFSPYFPVNVDRVLSYVRWFCRQCDLLTAPSRFALEDLCAQELCRPPRIISNPIDAATFKPVTTERRRQIRRSLGLTGPTICYAGRLAGEKNIVAIFRALSMLKHLHPEAVLAIAGHGTEETRLRKLAAQLDIVQNVRYFGTLLSFRLAELFQASDLFVTMSVSETQCMALLQAMACGIPSIVANALALPELIDKESGCVVDPHDDLALAGAMSAMLADPGVRNAAERNGPKSIEPFGVNRIASEWESIYQSLVQGR